MKINVTLLQPLGRIHSFALLEVAEYLFFKTRNAGHDVALSKNRVIHDGMNIVLGSYSKPLEAVNLPPQTVIFNSEILGNEKVLAKQGYGDVLEKFYVWDYSQSNLDRIPHENKSLINLGYEPNLARLDNSAPKEIDLLFYGSLNDRRISMLEDLSASGIKWHHPYGVYGRERDELIEQSKAVLNLHYYEEEIFQQIRCFYPLTNGFPVISENWAAGSAPDFYDEAVFKPGKTPFTQFVRDLLQNPKEFETAAARKIKAFKNSAKLDTFEAELERTLDHFKGQKSRRSSKQAERNFSRMNLGSGKNYRLDCLNVDIDERVLPDLVFDLSQELKFPLKLTSQRLGKIELEENQFDEIIANDVLEHVPDLTTLMTNCLKLLKEGGEFNINVPYDLSFGAWQETSRIRHASQRIGRPGASSELNAGKVGKAQKHTARKASCARLQSRHLEHCRRFEVWNTGRLSEVDLVQKCAS